MLLSRYLRYHLPATFYFLYLSGLVLRLCHLFHNNPLAVSRCSNYVLKILMSVVFILPNTFLVIDYHAHDEVLCIVSWNPPDIEREFRTCAILPSSMLVFQYHIYKATSALVIILNAIFYFILRHKLTQLTATNSGNTTPNLQTAKLTAKMSVITIIGCVTTLATHIAWLFSYQIWFIFLDYFVKCIVVALMFRLKSVDQFNSILFVIL